MSSGWPAVSYAGWGATCDTLHAHAQVLGKLAARLAPPEPQLQAAFFAFAHPAPPAFAHASLSPAGARWDQTLGEYILDWDDVRAAPDPRAAAVEFARSAFRHACLVCGWDTGLAASAESWADHTLSASVACPCEPILSSWLCSGLRWPRGT
jgi:hypothetical protein